MEPTLTTSFRLNDRAVDLSLGTVTHGDNAPVMLRPQALAVLKFLAAKPGVLASKDELMAAVWPSIAVTDDSLVQCVTEIRKALGDEGHTVIKTVPKRGYVLEEKLIHAVPRGSYLFGAEMLNGAEQSQFLENRIGQSRASGPAVAIMPFENLSDDPEQEYFAVGIVEEMITALSRMKWLSVIARNSSFAYKGRIVDVKQIGRELDVHYVLEGSIRKAGSRVRITGQLIDTSTGLHLWADRFEGNLKDIFELQDQLTASVISAVAPKLKQAEIDRAKHKPTGSLDAYDHYLRGLACENMWTKEANDKGLSHFYRAIELDPDFASAYGMAARCYSQRKVAGWITSRTHEYAEAERMARRAYELGKDDARVLTASGIALAYVVGNVDEGDALIDRALLLNPNLARAWLFSACVKIWRGEPEEGIKRIERCLYLRPDDRRKFNVQCALAFAHLFAGRMGEALSAAATAMQDNPHALLSTSTAASVGALNGDNGLVEKAVAQLRQLNPDVSVSSLREWHPIACREDVDKWVEGLRKAGLPE